MRFSIVSPDEQRRIDPPVHRILSCLPNTADGPHLTVVPITRLSDFKFRPYDIRGPWILVDFSEFGWEWKQDTSYLWGVNRLDHEWFRSDEWRRLDDFILSHPPVITFQRELLAKDVSETVRPIEYLNYFDHVTPDSPETFAARPIDVMFNWGRSHESRPRLHGDIYRESGRFGYNVVSHWDHIEPQIRDGGPGLWCAIHTPHFARIDVRKAVEWFGKSKIVVAMPGCGVKTFRHGEIPNSIIAMHTNPLAWGADINVILLQHDKHEVEWLDALLRSKHIYDTYIASVESADRLRPDRYMAEYVIPAIKSRL